MPAIMSAPETKKKKSKLEKIYELQAANKSLKEEARTLRKQLQAAQSGGSSGSTDSTEEESEAASSNEEKLLEAMKALKRVTVKQEMSLNTIRQKASERRRQVDERDQTISSLQQEIVTLKEAQKARKAAESDSDLDGLRSKVEDLQLRCSEQENRNKMLSMELEASEDKVRSLQKQLDSARGLMERAGSNRSIKSAESSASEVDLVKIRKELANKIERIVLLEFDLEMCREELHEVKQKQIMNDAFPAAGDAQSANFSADQDFFSDDDDEEDSW